LVSGFGSGAYSAKLLAGTRHRFSGFGQPRQCGDDVLRMLVTGGPPVRGGGGILQRIRVNTRSVPANSLHGRGRDRAIMAAHLAMRVLRLSARTRTDPADPDGLPEMAEDFVPDVKRKG